MTFSLPKVSVIIPAYNRAHLIGAAIESVLQQEFQDFEVVIIDDGSQDHTAEVVKQFSDERLRYFYQDHHGISAAMNAGLRQARGKYIARLDSDDLWLPHMLARLVPVLEARPEIGLVYSRAQAMDEQGHLLGEIRGLPEWFPGDSFGSMLYGDVTCNISLLARTVCFERAGYFDETMVVNEDWDMYLRIARHYRFAFVDQVVACFRYHSGNITNTGAVQHLNSRAQVLDKIFSQPDLPAAALQLKRQAYFNVYTWVGTCWLSQKSYRQAARNFHRALYTCRYSPVALLKLTWGILVGWFLWKHGWGRALSEAVQRIKQQWQQRQQWQRWSK
jgi:glycosyltransferase involved in cell wall biosynthesis